MIWFQRETVEERERESKKENTHKFSLHVSILPKGCSIHRTDPNSDKEEHKTITLHMDNPAYVLQPRFVCPTSKATRSFVLHLLVVHRIIEIDVFTRHENDNAT